MFQGLVSVDPSAMATRKVTHSAGSPLSSADPGSVVHVIDDDLAMRDALDVLLRAAGYKTRMFSSAAEFLKTCNTSQSGCLIVDVRMPGMDGLELQKKWGYNGHGLPIIFVSGYGTVSDVAQAFKGGAIDFLEKPIDEGVLFGAIQKALELDRINRKRRLRSEVYNALMNSLTPREREVLDRIVAGMPRKQIASELSVSQQAIDAHFKRVLLKARVDNVAALVHLVVALRL